jgi:hypothetical protein
MGILMIVPGAAGIVMEGGVNDGQSIYMEPFRGVPIECPFAEIFHGREIKENKNRAAAFGGGLID